MADEKDRLADQRKELLRYNYRRIPERYWKATYAEIKGEPEAIKAIEANANAPDRWLTLTGKSGNGKTTLAAALAKDILRTTDKLKDRYLMWMNCEMVVKNVKGLIGSDTTEMEYLQPYLNCDLLVMDDLGAEMDTEYSVSVLYSIINHRWDKMRKTIVTSNNSIKAISDDLGTRIADRLVRSGDVVAMKLGSNALRGDK